VIHRLIYCVALLPVLAFADDAPLAVPDIPFMMNTDGLRQPELPPTSADGADALDRRVYSQFANDEVHLANDPGSSRSYAFLPHGALVSYYDDNLNLTNTHREGDLALAVEPGLAFGLGDFRAEQDNFLLADYTGRWTSYLNHSSADAYEQFATVRAQLVMAQWKFNTNFRFFDLDDVDIDSGTRTSRQIYDTVQVASYELSEKDFVELQGQNVVRDYEVGAGSVEWQGRGLYNYRWDPKLTLGGGLAAGTLNIDGSSGQTYEQALLRALYDPTEKVSIQTQGGLEMRQLGSGQEKATPVLDLNCDYRARVGTNINLNAYRRVVGSNSSENQDYTATGLGVSVAQEMGINWLATLKGGYENNSYFAIDSGASATREDNFFYISPTLQYRLNDHAKIELFYNYRQNESSNSDRAFYDNQTGLRANFTY
jgi:putative beta-barrel porin BBP2